MRVQLAELVLEPLLSERRTVQPEQHIPEGTVRKPEQHSSAPSEHRLVYKPGHTPLGHNTKEPSAYMLEHTLRPEQHSLV